MRNLVLCWLMPGLLAYGHSPACRAAQGALSKQPLVSASTPSVLSLSLSQALRSALLHSTAARAEALDRMLAQSQWSAAQAEFSPVPTLSSDLTRRWTRGEVGSVDEANVSAGTTWKLPLGTQMEARLEQTRSLAISGDARAIRRVLQIVQPLLKGAGSAAGLALEQARLALRVSQYQRSLALDDVYATVSLAFFDAVLAHQQVRLARRGLERMQQAHYVNQALHAAGRIAQVDLLQSEADQAQAELDLAQARNTAQAAATALLQRLGPAMAQRDPEELVLPEALPVQEAALSGEAQVLTQALEQRSDLLLAQAAVDAAHGIVAQAENEGRSTLDLVLGAQSASPAAGMAGSLQRSMGVRWSVPLDRSALGLQQAQAQMSLHRAELALEDLRLLVRTEVFNALRELGFAQRAMSLSATATELNRRKLEAETERFRAGKISSFQLSAAHDALRAAENAQAQAAQAVLRAQLGQARATGSLASQRRALMEGPQP